MAMNYLQYIRSVQPASGPACDFLISGIDPLVRNAVGGQLVSGLFENRMPLFVVNNAHRSSLLTDFGPYRVVSALSGEVSFCRELLDVDSLALASISRLRSFLAGLGFDGPRAMQVISYLRFVRETENRLGNTGLLTPQVLDEYGGSMLVRWKLDQLVSSGQITQESHQYLLGRYAEVSNAAADFDTFMVLLAPFMEGGPPTPDLAVNLPLGDFCDDRPMQDLLCSLLLAFLRQSPESCAVLILDDAAGDRSSVLRLVQNLPAATPVHLISNDIFSLDEAGQSLLMNRFPCRIYSRHQSMSSCRAIEACCGTVDVIRQTTAVTVDRRLGSGSAWDLLLGTNRTETTSRNAPVRDPRFRKEFIQALPAGTGIVDCAGSQVLFSF